MALRLPGIFLENGYTEFVEPGEGPVPLVR
jgi:hypothetical protein